MSPLFAESVESAMKARIRELEASLAAAERRLGIAREALERIAGGWGGPLDTGMRLAREALAALNGEGE